MLLLISYRKKWLEFVLLGQDQKSIPFGLLATSLEEFCRSCTTVKIDLLPANNSIFEDFPDDKSLIYISNSGPTIDPWGTPTLSLVEDEL